MQIGRIGAVLLFASGCGDKESQEPDAGWVPCPADAGVIGSDGEPEIEVVEISHGGVIETVEPGRALTLFTPPQGGKIVLVGARIRHMVGCDASLVARLRDPTGEGEPVAFREGRTVRFEPMADRPDWGEVPVGTTEQETLAAGANVAPCPNYEARDADGCDWILDVSVEDRDGRSAEAQIPVALTCPEDDPGSEDASERVRCECECAAGYDTRDCDDLTAWEAAPSTCEG